MGRAIRPIEAAELDAHLVHESTAVVVGEIALDDGIAVVVRIGALTVVGTLAQ